MFKVSEPVYRVKKIILNSGKVVYYPQVKESTWKGFITIMKINNSKLITSASLGIEDVGCDTAEHAEQLITEYSLELKEYSKNQIKTLEIIEVNV